MIDQVLRDSGLPPCDLDAIALTHGPGSFMGSRLAVGVAQGLGYAWDCPLITLSTLQVLAQTAYEKTGDEALLAYWDARMGEVYWGVYRLDPETGVMDVDQQDQLSRPDEVPYLDGLHLVGNMALPGHGDYLQCDPLARSALKLAEQQFRLGELLLPHEVELVYLRGAVQQ